MATDRDSDASFATVLRRSVRLRDCLGLAVVPLVLVGVFALPAEVRRRFVFQYGDPTLVTAYTANFVHFSPNHLLANLLGYSLLASTGYVVAALAGERRLFWVTVTAYGVAFPFLLSALNLAVPRSGVTYGFSGMTMAFAGLLPVLLAVYSHRRLAPWIRVGHAPLLFFAALAVIAFVAVPPSTASRLVIVTAGAAAAGYGRSLVVSLRDREVRFHGPTAGWVDTLVVTLVVFGGYVVVGFSTVRVDGGVLNVYVHFLGFALAFISLYVAVQFGVVGEDTTTQGFLSE